MTLSYHSGVKKWLYFDDEDYGIIEDEKEVDLLSSGCF